MTRDETKQIVKVLTDAYPNFRPENISGLIDTWYILLQDMDAKTVQNGVIAYIRNDTSGFAPSVGQIINSVSLINPNPDLEVSPLEQWDKVYRAICDSNYHAEERFNELPALVQKAIGTPSQLKAWAQDENFNQGVAQSQFIKVYSEYVRREKEVQKMPTSIRPESMLEHRANPMIENWSAEKTFAEPWEHDDAPVDLMDRVKDKLGIRI